MKTEGMIDLGKSAKETSATPPKDAGNGMHYPSLFINDVDGLYDLPDGVFTITARVKKISSSTREVDGEKTHSCELEFHAIKVPSSGKKTSKSSEESLDESFDMMAKKKEDDSNDEEPSDY